MSPLGDQAMKIFMACVFLLAVWHPFSQEPKKAPEEKTSTDSKPAPEVAKTANPSKATPTSIAAGKKAYQNDCAMCHGKEGGGDGDLAADMKLKLRDYRDVAVLKDLSDTDIYSIIANGKGQMTGEEGRMKPDQVWDVVNYVRSLAKK
jgi:mono/diheme cytochrome c family protein